MKMSIEDTIRHIQTMNDRILVEIKVMILQENNNTLMS